MSKFSDVEPDPSVVDRVSQPPFVQLPDPARVFSRRAKRLRMLAPGHDLQAYLTFLADLTEMQAAILDGLPEPEMPAPEAIARAHDHAMPPLDRNGFQPGPAFDATFERLVAGAEKIAMPDEARAALARLKALARPARMSWCMTCWPIPRWSKRSPSMFSWPPPWSCISPGWRRSSIPAN